MALIKQDRGNFGCLNWLDEFMTGHKGFICGGCFKNIFNGEKVKDLDIFFKSKRDWEDAVQYFDSMTEGYKGDDKRPATYCFYYENDNVKAYKHIEKRTVIELCNKIYGTAEQILNQFDFTITKFAYYKEEVEDESGDEVNPFDDEIRTENSTKQRKTHIEYRIMHDDKFFEHLHMKRLVTDDKIPFPMSTFERTLRYAKYGYFPCKETKMKIVKALCDLPEQQVNASESLYDGMD